MKSRQKNASSGALRANISLMASVARKDFPGNTVTYYFSDHMKTASVITDASGTIKAESDYYPWGGELQFVNNDSNDYKFTGKNATPKPASTTLVRDITPVGWGDLLCQTGTLNQPPSHMQC
jgi:hypothetical protein